MDVNQSIKNRKIMYSEVLANICRFISRPMPIGYSDIEILKALIEPKHIVRREEK